MFYYNAIGMFMTFDRFDWLLQLTDQSEGWTCFDCVNVKQLTLGSMVSEWLGLAQRFCYCWIQGTAKCPYNKWNVTIKYIFGKHLEIVFNCYFVLVKKRQTLFICYWNFYFNACRDRVENRSVCLIVVLQNIELYV